MSDTNLQPLKLPYHNSVLRGPPDTDVGDLHCHLERDQEGYCTTFSAWDLTDEQRRMIAAGAHMRMGVWQHPIPPLSLAVEGPVCPDCDHVTDWDATTESFRCPVVECEADQIRRGAYHPTDRVPGLFTPTESNAQKRAEEQVRADFIPAEDATEEAA